jgi:hypothetical protein
MHCAATDFTNARTRPGTHPIGVATYGCLSTTWLRRRCTTMRTSPAHRLRPLSAPTSSTGNCAAICSTQSSANITAQGFSGNSAFCLYAVLCCFSSPEMRVGTQVRRQERQRQAIAPIHRLDSVGGQPDVGAVRLKYHFRLGGIQYNSHPPCCKRIACYEGLRPALHARHAALIAVASVVAGGWPHVRR